VNRVNGRKLVGKTALISTGVERTVFESKNIRARSNRSLVEPAYVTYALLGLGRRWHGICQPATSRRSRVHVAADFAARVSSQGTRTYYSHFKN
jgi:hypothetical protein